VKRIFLANDERVRTQDAAVLVVDDWDLDYPKLVILKGVKLRLFGANKSFPALTSTSISRISYLHTSPPIRFALPLARLRGAAFAVP
jgi:hypothetical protein